MKARLQFGWAVRRSLHCPSNWGWQVTVQSVRSCWSGKCPLRIQVSSCLCSQVPDGTGHSWSCDVKPGPGPETSVQRQAASSQFLPTSADIAHVYSSHYDVSICSIVTLTRQGAKKASANIQHLIMTMIWLQVLLSMLLWDSALLHLSVAWGIGIAVGNLCSNCLQPYSAFLNFLVFALPWPFSPALLLSYLLLCSWGETWSNSGTEWACRGTGQLRHGIGDVRAGVHGTKTPHEIFLWSGIHNMVRINNAPRAGRNPALNGRLSWGTLRTLPPTWLGCTRKGKNLLLAR